MSIVLSGSLGDSEPRVLKDPNRKNFKTGLYFFAKIYSQMLFGFQIHGRNSFAELHGSEHIYPMWKFCTVLDLELELNLVQENKKENNKHQRVRPFKTKKSCSSEGLP